jgi:predicted DNA-binding transcriptional regulator AlpA
MSKEDLELLTTAEVSKLLRFSHRTLEEMRAQGTGPKYLKSSMTRRGIVRYRVSDVIQWLNETIGGSQPPPEDPAKPVPHKKTHALDLVGDLRNDENALMTAKETAAYLRIDYSTLTGMRMRREGPKFFKMGRGKGSRIAYRKRDIAVWLEKNQFEFTGQYTTLRGRRDRT